MLTEAKREERPRAWQHALRGLFLFTDGLTSVGPAPNFRAGDSRGDSKETNDDGYRLPSSHARPRGDPRGAHDVRAGGGAEKCRLALGERSRRLPAPPDGQLSGRALPASARQGLSGAGGRPRRGGRVHEPSAPRLDRVHSRSRVFKALWTQDNPSFEGEFFRFKDIGFAPKPVQKPHPPIWVGGDSPGAFRRVVTLGDGWHATSKTPAELKEALGRLRAAADKAGRAFETIELSIRFALRDELLAQGAQAVVDQLAAYKQLGLSHVAIDFRRDDLGKMLEILDLVTGKIRPAVDAA
ncbi:MAG: hypothetical protein DME16_23485 [Candidatus Rokuibacteriota bacterium]|nr:MAG: hypothetical protein DME16_23485 [Candidatus Rokubacteria bacterium]